jgi:hypothetical protein
VTSAPQPKQSGPSVIEPEDVVKNAMLINMGRLFRKWKSELNMKYVKKGFMPKHMGKITETQWIEFV